MKTVVINDKKIPLDAIIFDKDGTLIEIYPMIMGIVKERLKHLVALTSPKIVLPWKRGVGINPKTNKIDPYGPLSCAPEHEEIFICIGVLYRFGYPYHEAKKIAQTAYKRAHKGLNIMEGVSLIKGVREKLREIKENNIKIFVATSDSTERAGRMLKKLKLLNYADCVIGGVSKPNADKIKCIMNKYKLKPTRTAMCGDSILDMQLGIAAGIKHNIAVLTGTSAEKELKKYTDLVINSAADIAVGRI